MWIGKGVEWRGFYWECTSVEGEEDLRVRWMQPCCREQDAFLPGYQKRLKEGEGRLQHGKGVRGGGWDGRLGTSLLGLLESIAFSLSSLVLLRALSA